MNSITRFEPLKELARFDPSLTSFDPFMDVGDMVNRFLMHPMLRGGMDIEPGIKMEVKEADGKYMVNAEIPGVDKDDIHVTIDGHRVSISAEVRQNKEMKEGERIIRSERNYGICSRSFNLADEVDKSGVQAKYNNGMLELTLPKKPGSPCREIPIS